MNYGKCRTCWWYKEIRGQRHSVVNGELHTEEGHGFCLMRSVPEEGYFHKISEKNYCPDHYNRKKEKQTLEEWMGLAGITLPLD